MYNKLFTKILDSTIWLEDLPTRIVWVTLIAAMDEDGFCQFAAVGNIAGRARVTDAEAETAIACLENPDSRSFDQEHEGRRIERVPGGWMVLNARKYRDLVTAQVARERTRERVRKHREKRSVTVGNGEIQKANSRVTQSETETYAETETEISQNLDQDHRATRGNRKSAEKEGQPSTHIEPDEDTEVIPLSRMADSPQLLKLAHVIRDEAPTIDHAEWRERLKEQAARAGLIYEAGAVTKAIVEAEYQRRKRKASDAAS